MDINTRRKSITTRNSSRSAVLPKEGTISVRNFNTKFSMPTFVKRVNKLTVNQRNAITRMGFGSLLCLTNRMLRRNLLVELMDRWSCEKQAFVLLPGEIKITLMDVAVILGLRVIGDPVILKEDAPFLDLEREYGAVIWNRKIPLALIEDKLDSIGEADDEDFIRLFLLFTFGVLLFPNTNGKVDSRYLHLLNDLNKVSSFAWGTAVHEDITTWLCRRKESNAQSLGGCLIFLQVWSYEHIDLDRPLLTVFPFPRVCRWGNIKSSERESFSLKFQELGTNQIVWELQLTSEESRIDIIQEILDSQAEKVEKHRPNSSSTNVTVDNGDYLRSRHESDKRDIESDMELVDEAREDSFQQLRLSCSTSILSVDSPESPDTTHTGEKREHKKKPCESQLISTVNLSSDDDDALDITNHDFGSNSELKKEITDLRDENEYLKRQLLASSKLHEQNVELRKEVEDLRSENQYLRSSLCLADRLERVLLDDNVDTSGQQATENEEETPCKLPIEDPLLYS